MTCVACGMSLSKYAAFCGNCGRAVAASAPAAPTPSLASPPPAAQPISAVPWQAPSIAYPVITPSNFRGPEPRNLPPMPVAPPPAEPARALWRIALPGRATVAITTTVVLGREPDARIGGRGAIAIPVLDSTMTVSKSHAVLVLAGETLALRDHSSMNGSAIVFSDGRIQVAEAGSPVPLAADCSIVLGDLVLDVMRS